LNFGNIIQRDQIDISKPDGIRNQQFNERLERELKQLVFEIPKDDIALQEKRLQVPVNTVKKAILFIPGWIGYIFHAPLYLHWKNYTWKRTKDNDHYDSVMAALLMITYPFYLLPIVIILFLLLHSWYPFLLFVIAPFCAWAFVQIRKQV
jgi:hypothetical protein